MTKKVVRLSADIGGTFTDIVLEVDDQQYSTKTLTTYAAPENAIISGMHEVCAQAGVGPEDIQQVIHGTTLATNALIERRGAKTALITTQGFRDVIEMRTESRFEQYDLNLKLPDPLLARQHRYTLNERMDAKGRPLIHILTHDIESLVDVIDGAGYESVAVGFLHAYANPAHEIRVRDALAMRLPNVMVSLSSEVSSQMREYERFNTVVANAYIKPLMKSYLNRLASKLNDEGIACPIFLMHSGGGIISLASAAEFPVRLVESGPAGGAVFAADIAARYQLDKVLSFDMGGTTAKICLIQDKTPKTSRVFEVARTYRFKKGSGMPISIPVIDMVEIGAGGGSLAQVDAMKQIRVGPESAGSEPGPACYGMGGNRPAVTDADLILGKLDPENFAGGSIPLHVTAAADALQSTIGSPLGMAVETAAYGLVEVVDENMANAARVHAVENGEDLSNYTMIAFGGAAPLHASRLCEKLGVDRLLVPPRAGVGSAVGFLRAPFSFEVTRSLYMTLSDFDGEEIGRLFQALAEEATEFVHSCDIQASISCDYKAYMRYAGQGWEVPVALSAALAHQPTAMTLQREFESVYATLFGRTVEGADIEVTVWAVNAKTSLVPVANAVVVEADRPAELAGHRAVYDGAKGYTVDAKLVNRETLAGGLYVDGPAVIVEDETTIIVSDNQRALCQPDGCIDISYLMNGSKT